MKGARTRQGAIERARPHAITALDLVSSGRANPRDAEIMDLVALALQDYRFKHRGCPASSAWLFYDGNPDTARIVGTPERVDVFCLFCRVMLVNGAIWLHDYTAQLRPHTTVCALRSLARLMEPGAPGTYRLPEAA